MSINITEDTRIRSGSITLRGRKLRYTALINASGHVVDNEVTILVYTVLGRLYTSCIKTVCRVRNPFLCDAINAALAELKEDYSK